MAPPTTPSAALEPSSIVELTIQAKELISADTFSSIDPVVIVYELNDPTTSFASPSGSHPEQITLVGRTEIQIDTSKPKFNKKIELNYLFERRQRLRFQVYDAAEKHVSKPSASMEDITKSGVLIAQVDIPLSQLLRPQVEFTPLKLTKVGDPKKNAGTLYIKACNLHKNETISLVLSAENLYKKNFFGKPDPYVVLSRITANKDTVKVAQSNVISSSLSPVWNKITAKVGHLVEIGAGGTDLRQEVAIDVYDKSSSSDHSLIGGFVTSLARLVEPGARFDLVKHKKAKEGKPVNRGVLIVREAIIKEQKNFVDYLRDGVSISFSVAIDFTASNGNPTDPNSLHYMDPRGHQNQYESAIRSIGGVLTDYDRDGLIPVFGFGALIPGTPRVVDDFNVNFQEQPHVSGIDQVLGAYRNCLTQIKLYGPTNFAPIIRKQCELATMTMRMHGSLIYHVLMIITDGLITDMPNTKDAIAAAAKLPISIVIVGVGSEDFSMMHELDGDTVRLTDSKGVPVARDIVQFVEYQKYTSKFPQAFMTAVLHEIPGQLVGFVSNNPPPPLPSQTQAQATPSHASAPVVPPATLTSPHANSPAAMSNPYAPAMNQQVPYGLTQQQNMSQIMNQSPAPNFY